MYSSELEEIKKAIATAYADSDDKRNGDDRQLRFKSASAIDGEVLGDMLSPIGRYNAFDPKKVAKVFVEHFRDNFKFFVAREYSVCIYVEPKSTEQYIDAEHMVQIKRLAKADEVGIVNNQIRFWWD